MADWLNINPSTGTGNASVSVSATEHTGQSEKNCTLKVSSTDGKRNVNVSVTQYYKPYATIEKSEFDGDAAMTEAYIYSDYDFWFKEIPQWVRITDTQGNTISANQPVSAPLGGYKTIKVYLYQNVSNRRSFAFTMGINLLSGGTADIPAFTITQEAGSATAFSISKTLLNSALSNPANSIEPGEAYTTYVSAEEGYTIKDVKVYVEVMNMWSQITGAYNPSTQQITLSNVQWNVLINVACSAVASSGGDSTLVLTKGGEWRIEAPSYITPSATSGTGPAEITLDFGTNTGGTRTGEIKIIYTDFTDRVEVSQNGRQPIVYAIDLTTETTEIPAGGGIAVINVVSNGDWTLSAPDYVLLSITGGTGNETVTATISQNSGYAPRNITVSGTCHSATDSVTFEQKSSILFTITPDTYDVPGSGGTVTLTITSNSNYWSLTCPDYVNLSTISGSGNKIVIATVAESDGEERNIVISGEAGYVSDSVTLSQEKWINPNRIIYYTSTDGNIVPMASDNVVSNTYEDGVGMIIMKSALIAIPMFAFRAQDTLETITFPDTLKTIGGRTFSGCHNLKSVDIPNNPNFSTIEDATFSGCHSLTGITIPDNVTIIERSAFNTCTSLTYVHLPDNLLSIFQEAFKDCTSLTSITIPENTSYISFEAFKNTGLNEIIALPSTAPNITIDTFEGVPKYGTLSYPDKRAYSQWLSKDQYYLGYYDWNLAYDLFDITADQSEIPSSGGTITLTITSNIRWTLSAPDYVTLSAVSGRGSVLITATFSQNEGEAREANIVATPETLDPVTISVSQEAPLSPNTIYYTTTDGNPVTTTSSFASQIKSNTYSDGIGIIELNDGVTEIGGEAFKNSNISSVEIPNCITSIGNKAFYYCVHLAEVKLPDTITNIGQDAFNACIFSSIDIPDNAVIGIEAFANCVNLSRLNSETEGKFYLPSGTTSYQGNTFYNCKSLKMVFIPSTVTSLGYGDFAYCENLEFIRCYAQTQPSTKSSTFTNVAVGGILFHPAGSYYGTWLSRLPNWSEAIL